MPLKITSENIYLFLDRCLCENDSGYPIQKYQISIKTVIDTSKLEKQLIT